MPTEVESVLILRIQELDGPDSLLRQWIESFEEESRDTSDPGYDGEPEPHCRCRALYDYELHLAPAPRGFQGNFVVKPDPDEPFYCLELIAFWLFGMWMVI